MPKKSYYVASDAMGNATAILDENGNVLERRRYEAFGVMTCMTPDGTPLATSPTVVDVGFQGQICDEVTGLYQMGFRWYNPALGRWLSRDNIGLFGGPNCTSFAKNNPTLYADIYGQLSVKITVQAYTLANVALLDGNGVEQEFELPTSLSDFLKNKISKTECFQVTKKTLENIKKDAISMLDKSIKKITGLRQMGSTAVEAGAKSYSAGTNQLFIYSTISIDAEGIIGCDCKISIHIQKKSALKGPDAFPLGNPGEAAVNVAKDGDKLVLATALGAKNAMAMFSDELERQIAKCLK
ncbi:MAG: hypothetical protein RL636_1241 [Verrucomicrobiota bacterium]|jgi:RHS repeat-associated protein